jgi:hypothetical protein
VLKEHESVKAKTTIGWQIEEWIHDSFVHTIRELQGSDSISQATIELNRPLHSNWVGLPELISQSITSKQTIQLITQTTLPKKTLEESMKNINTQVLEIKYVINLGQFLKIMPDIKRYIFKLIKSI